MGWRDKAVVVPTDESTKVEGNKVTLYPSWKDRSFSGKPRVNQEMHPDLATSDRAIVKNFANSPESSVAYLAQKYPDHDVAVNQQGQLIMKRKDEVDFKVLDPNTGMISPDIGKDLLDVAYDVPAGALEAGAGVGGAALGGAVTLPVLGSGALPAAMLASGGVGAGNEALRQKLGQALGIPQEVNLSDVALSGGLSGLTTGLAGAGKASGLLKMTKDFTTQKALPKIGSMLSGVSSDSLLNYSDDAIRAQVNNLEKTGVEDFSAQAFDKLNNYVQTRKDQAGEELVRAIDETGVPVSMTKAKGSYQDAIRQLESRPDLTNVEMAKINKLKSDYGKYYGLAKPKELPKSKEAMSKEDQLLEELRMVMGQQDDQAKFGAGVVEDIKRQIPQKPSPTYDPNYDSFLDDAYQKTNAPLLDEVGQLQAYFDELDMLNKQAQSSQRDARVSQILEQIRAVNKPQLQPFIDDQASARRAWDLQKDLKQAAKFDSDISPENIYSKGTARDSYFKINEALDEASGGLTSQAKSQYKAALDAEAELLPKFEGNTRADSIQKTYKELSNMGRDSRKILSEKLQQLADTGQLDLTNESRVLSTFREMGNPKMMPISSGGTTSTSRSIPAAGMGALVGGFAGNQMNVTGQPGVDSGLGALGGVALGTLMGSPAAMKNYIRMHRAASRGIKTLTPEVENDLARRAIRSTWMDMMIDNKETGD